jgi:hypothetical protein
METVNGGIKRRISEIHFLNKITSWKLPYKKLVRKNNENVLKI